MQETGLDPWSNDPIVAAQCAGHYMQKLMQRFDGDLGKSLAAYNAGQGRVAGAIGRHGDAWLASLSSETRDYVPSVLRRIGIQDRVSFTERYAQGQTTREENEQEEKVRRDLLKNVFGMSDEQTRNMSTSDLLGAAFIAIVMMFVKNIDQRQNETTPVRMQVASASAAESQAPPVTPRAPVSRAPAPSHA
jgi:hypothetical protein